MKLGVRKPSPAMVVACIALAVALSGASYAAIKLPRNSVGTPQLKKNAVVSAKVKDRSLRVVDFALGQLPAGPQGSQGVPGRSALEPLRSGETIRGVVGGIVKVPTEGTFTLFETFPIPSPVAVGGANVDVDGNDETGGRCIGTASAPTAPPGVVCLYVASSIDVRGLTGQGAPNLVAGSPYGFAVDVFADNAGNITVFLTWAYTAP